MSDVRIRVGGGDAALPEEQAATNIPRTNKNVVSHRREDGSFVVAYRDDHFRAERVFPQYEKEEATQFIYIVGAEINALIIQDPSLQDYDFQVRVTALFNQPEKPVKTGSEKQGPSESALALGARLKQARAYAKISQYKLSDKVGVDRTLVSQIERGVNGSTHVKAMAKACGVRSEWLLTGEGDMVDTQADIAPVKKAKEPHVYVDGRKPINKTKATQDLGYRVLTARKHVGFSQTVLAGKIGIDPSTVSGIERGVYLTTHTEQLAIACGVRPEWVLTGKGAMLDMDGVEDHVVEPESAATTEPEVSYDTTTIMALIEKLYVSVGEVSEIYAKMSAVMDLPDRVDYFQTVVDDLGVVLAFAEKACTNTVNKKQDSVDVDRRSPTYAAAYEQARLDLIQELSDKGN